MIKRKSRFKLPQIRLRLITWVFLFLAAVVLPTVIKNTFFPTGIEAGWWDEGWLYRQRVDVTNNESSDLTDFQVKITLDTATLITAGKMQSDCDDIRVTDFNGQQIPFWIETGGKACNTTTTTIWVKVPTLPADNGVIYLYYGNSSSSISAHHNGDQTFDFFDDFSTDSLGTKWTGTTSDFTIASGNLSGSNSNSRIQSNISFTGDYELITRTYTTTNIVNGFEVGGFWASTTNAHGVLNHSNIVYTRNDSSWPSNGAFTFNGQWTRLTNKVVGTAGSITLTGETSGSNTPSNTNSGISAEYIALGRRYDNSDQGQTYDADWDWLFVKKATTNEPTTAQASEEVTPGPIAYWKFDEGVDNTCSGGTNDVCDSTSQRNDGAITGATWQSEDLCVSGKCLSFDGTDDSTSMGDISTFDGLTEMTIDVWVRPNTLPDSADINSIVAKADYAAASTNSFFIRLRGSEGLRAQFSDGTNIITCDTTTSPPANVWTKITAVLDTTDTCYVYFNAVEITSATNASFTAITNTSNDLLIGSSAYPSELYFDGFIDEVKIYPYARSADQVKQDYNALGGAAAGAVLGAQEQVFMSEGLVGYWKMDETPDTTTTVTDSSGNGNTGSINLWGGGNTSTASARVAGKYGGGIDFDGGDDSVDIDDDAVFDNITSAITLSAWIKPDDVSGNKEIISKKADSDNTGFRLRLIGDDIRFSYGDGSSTYNITSAVNQITTSIFHHVIATYDTSTVRIYIDGNLVHEEASSGTISPNNRIVALAAYPTKTSYWYDGTIDETRIYNRALSSSEVSELYNWAPGPVGYWPMDEGTGTSTIYDRSGNANNGTMTGSMTESDWVSGKIGGALDFDGSDDYIAGGTPSTLDFTGPFTVSSWIKRSSTQASVDSAIVSKIETSPHDGYMLWYNNDTVDFYINRSVRANSTTTIEADTWYYVTGVWDGSNAQIYLNGVLDVSSSYSTAPTSSGEDFSIGRYPTASRNFTGQIDEVKIYNYARTPAQIQQDMGGVGGSILGSSTLPNPIAHWRFDEKQGQTTNDSIGGNNGTRGADSGSSTDDPTWKTQNNCKTNGCLDFDGGDYVSNTNSNLLNALEGSSNWAISFWAASNAYSTNPAALSINNNAETSQLFLIYPYDTNGGNGTRILFNGTSTIDINNPNIADGTFHHFAYVSESATSHKLYIDGSLAGSSTASRTLHTTIAGVNIGNWYTTNQHYTGQIDEVKIYNTALTADQIKKDMNAGSSIKYSVGNSTADDITDGAGSDPVAEWNFDEKTGTSANDISGNGNTGTLTNSPTWTMGKIGSALDFDGSDDYVAASSSTDFDMINNLTVSTWVNPAAVASHVSFVSTDSAGTGFQLGARSDGKLWFTTYSVLDYITTSSYLTANEWQYITAVMDSDNDVSFYVNGIFKEKVTHTTPANSNTSGGIQLGKYSGAYYFNGLIDEVKIYNYARTPAQIAYDYNGGLPIAHWRMDECQGTTVNDSSGNSNSGTLTVGGSGTQTSAGTCDTASTAWGNGSSGKFNSSLNFDGTDDYTSIPATSDFDLQDLSISAWNYSSNYDRNMFIFEKTTNGSVNTQYSLFYSANGTNNEIIFRTYGLSTTNLTITDHANGPIDGQWNHIAASYDASTGTKKIYSNGIEIASVTGLTGTINTNPAGNSWIGSYAGGGYFFNGQIDDTRIYNYALSPNQVKNIMNENASVRFGD